MPKRVFGRGRRHFCQTRLHGLLCESSGRTAEQAGRRRFHSRASLQLDGGSSLTAVLPQELFVRVVPFHCLGCIWSQRDKKENRKLAPTVRATISQFNAVTNRVITSLLCPSSPSPSTSSPVSSPRAASTFLYPTSAPGSPHCPHSSPAHRARIIERWITIAQVRAHKCDVELRKLRL